MNKPQCCKNCGEEFYFQEEGVVSLEEWLWVKNTCGKCGKSCCGFCLVTCLTCANKSDDLSKIVAICDECSNLKDVCEIHHWYVCKKHSSKKCGTCKRNKNYERYDF